MCDLLAYPENLSRIILTLTVSPMLYQMLRTKFSSIQGSSSPILHLVSPSIRSIGLSPAIVVRDSPEGGLASALAVAIGASAAGRTHVTLGREAAGLVHGLTKVGLRDVGVGALFAGLLALVLLVLLLEAHCRGRSSGSDRVLVEALTKSIALKYDRGP